MITDDLKLVFIKEKLFSELKEDFALAGYSFNKQLIAKKKSKDNFEIEIYLLSNNYHPIDYEIYLYDRAGHGFSSHLPKGMDYSYGYNLRDLRIITQS